jgi:flagellin-like protein
MKNFRRSKKALSPVVASIILIAVTVAVSIAVAAWMGALSVGFMQTEQLSITNAVWTTGQVALHVRNTGATDIIVLQNALVNGVSQSAAGTNLNANGDTIVAKNTEDDIIVTFDWVAGETYQIKLISQKGTNFVYNAVAGP